MLTANISDFRKDIKRYLGKVKQNFETLIINRGKDNGIVIMSLAEYNSLCATKTKCLQKKMKDGWIRQLKNFSQQSELALHISFSKTK